MMRNLVHLKRFINSSSPISSAAAALSFSSQRNTGSAPIDEVPREGPQISYGLNLALAGRGVIVQDRAFQNLNSSELKRKGATVGESVSGLPVYVRGNVLGGSSDISKAHFSKLLKQYSLAKCYSCSFPRFLPSYNLCCYFRQVLPFATSRNPLILYLIVILHYRIVVTYLLYSASAADILGLGAKGNSGFVAADVERSSQILCGKAFNDTKGMKEALAALSGPIICSRGGLLLSARLLVAGDSVILFFAPEDTIQSCSDQLVSTDIGVVLSSEGVSPLFQSGNSEGLFSSIPPAAVVFVSSDSSRTIPSASKLSPGQAAYQFLAGYQNGKFLPVYNKGPSALDPLDLAKAFLSKIKDNQISCFLINTSEGEKQITDEDLVELVESCLSENIPPFKLEGGYLKAKYKSFLSGRFQQLPKEFAF